MTFNEILNDLKDLTGNFTLDRGVYKVQDKSDVQIAVSILEHYYSDVNGKNLDYNNNSDNGVDYLIRFSKPIGDDRMNEDLITKRDLEAAKLILKHDTDPRHIKKAQDVIKKYKEQNKADVDEAIEKHDTLNPKLWDENNELKPEVRKKIEEIVQKFDDNLKENDIELDVKDIAIIGSNANYNYSPDSDVDIHIIADTSVYPDQEDLAMKVYLAYKSLFNNKYDPTLNGIEAEVYVEPDEVHANSNGVYSLKDGWLKEPEQVDVPDIDPEHVQELIQPFEDRYNDLINSDPSVSEVDDLIDDIYLQRQKSIMKDGEFGDGNICFKEFRNRGYLQNLRDLKVELENKEMSLNDMNEQFLYLNNLNEDCDDHINEGLTSDDLFVGAEFIEPDTGTKVVITNIDDDLVTYDETIGEDEPITITDPISYFVATLNEFDYILDENCDKKLKEDIFENENGMEISFPDPRDTLAVFLEWEGIMGYTDEIYEHALEGYDALDEYLEYEGIIGYTSKIYEIVNTGSAWCSQMEMEDFLGVCRALYIDYTMAIDDDIDEKLCESGDFYLGSKWNNKNDRDRYFRTVPKYRIKDKLTNKSFTAQCGRWDSIDDVKKEYPEDHYEVKLVEATKVGLVSAAKSVLNKYCDKLKDASAEEIYDRALKHASRSEYPFVKDNLTAKKDVAIDYINKRKEAMSMDDLDEDFVIDDKPGTKYRNKNGIILKMEEPTKDGEIQFAIIDNGEIIDHRKMSDLKSFARMIDANGYEKLTEDTVKQGDKWVNKGKEGTHGKFKTKKAADDQRKAMFANGYNESLDEGTAFDGMPGYMTPEEIRAKKLADKEKLDAEKEQVKAQKAAERKEKAKAERARQKRIDQRAKVNSLSYDSLADMAGLPEDNNDLTKDELLAVLRASMSDEEILKLHKKMFESLNESHKGYDLIFDRDTGDRQVEYGINWIQFTTDNYDDAVRWARQLDAAMAGDIDEYGEPSDDSKYYDPDNYPKDIQEVGDGKFNFRRRRDILDSIEKVDFVDADDINNLNEDVKEFTPEQVERFKKARVYKSAAPDGATFRCYYCGREDKVTPATIEKFASLNSETFDKVLSEFTDDMMYPPLCDYCTAWESHDHIENGRTGEKAGDDVPGSWESGDVEAERALKRQNDLIRKWVADGDPIYIVTTYGDKVLAPTDWWRDGWVREDLNKDNMKVKKLTEAEVGDVKASALADHLGVDIDEIEDGYSDGLYEVGNEEYFVGTEDEAYEKAVDEIKMLFDDMGLDAFTSHFKDWILDNAIDEDAIDDIIEQEIEYFEDSEDDPDMLEYLRGLDDLDSKISFVKDMYGDSFDIWAKDYIDTDKVAEEAISEDGVAHFISYYDGEEIELGNNLFAYRLN